MREIKHLSVHQWLRSAIPDSQQPMSPIGFLFLKLPPPPCAVLLLYIYILYATSIQFREFSTPLLTSQSQGRDINSFAIFVDSTAARFL